MGKQNQGILGLEQGLDNQLQPWVPQLGAGNFGAPWLGDQKAVYQQPGVEPSGGDSMSGWLFLPLQVLSSV